jgi:hypothetical protein
MKFFLLLILLSGSVLARTNDLAKRPRSFPVAGGKAVFVDFTEANYLITYDVDSRSASVRAVIRINVIEAGRPVFDSVEAPTSILLNNKTRVTASEVRTPENETTVRVLDQDLPRGQHTLTIDVPLKTLVEFVSGGVKSGFWTSDLSHRQFLERYMPANFEFDQVKMVFRVEFKGLKSRQAIFTNGSVKELSGSSFEITYPDYFTSSSLYFHTTPAASVEELRFSYKSVDGRELPSVVYVAKNPLGLGSAQTLQTLRSRTIQIMQELEGDYGPFPHPHIIVYNAGTGGMEYCGATITSMSALGHELFHSYFARGVMPANGNAGWLDEALASWRDGGYRRADNMTGTSRMSAHPYYTRITDRQAYTFGARFMAYLDGKLRDKGGLKPFMRHMVEKKVFAPLFVEDFVTELNKFYGMSFDEDFRRHTYDKSAVSTEKHSGDHPVHRKMTIEDLRRIL